MLTDLRADWERLSPVQQEEFVRVLSEFFERTYNRVVLQLLGEHAVRGKSGSSGPSAS